jgi:hypothetical protein
MRSAHNGVQGLFEEFVEGFDGSGMTTFGRED